LQFRGAGNLTATFGATVIIQDRGLEAQRIHLRHLYGRSVPHETRKLRQSSGLMDTTGAARSRSVVKIWLGAVRKFLRKLCREEPRMEKRTYKLGRYFVAFLDVLGQRDKFRGLKKPANVQEEDEVKEVLRQTVGFIAELRTVFKSQYEIFAAGAPNMQRHTKEPARPSFIGFSDSFVTSIPLWEEGHELVSVVKVFSALSASCVVMLTALATKHPLRGGIDVGLATQIAPSEIYGTALERAYLLECREAKYPRLVIGDELCRYLSAALAHFESQTTPVSKAITIGKHEFQNGTPAGCGLCLREIVSPQPNVFHRNRRHNFRKAFALESN
jgi:hypothetical protein